MIWEIASTNNSVFLTITVFPYLLSSWPKLFSWLPFVAYIKPNLENYLEDEFYKEIENRKVNMEDRVSIQLATLEKRAEDERRKLNRIILNSPASVKAANEGRLRKLNERIELREQKIRQQISSQSESSDVALILLEVV